MSEKSDLLFFGIKQLYPSFTKPSQLDTEIWEELLAPYAPEEIKHALKAYRKNEEMNFPPNPAKLKNYLFRRKATQEVLPFSPEVYLMEEDKKAGRCAYFFPTYQLAVRYVLEEKLKKLYPPKEFRKFSKAEKYRLSVENGLFADFDKTLAKVAKKSDC